MKSSSIIKQIPQKLRIDSSPSWIQKCTSEEEFFTVRNCTSRSNNSEYICQKLDNLMLSFKMPLLSLEREETSPASACKTANTEDSFARDARISFTQKKANKLLKRDTVLTDTV